MRNFLAPQLIVSDMSLDTTAARLLDPSVASLFSRTGGTPLTSVLMFSGGRDSSVAALRMYEKGTMPILVTISSWHLTGIDRVRDLVTSQSPSSPDVIKAIKSKDKLDNTTVHDTHCCPLAIHLNIKPSNAPQSGEARFFAPRASGHRRPFGTQAGVPYDQSCSDFYVIGCDRQLYRNRQHHGFDRAASAVRYDEFHRIFLNVRNVGINGLPGSRLLRPGAKCKNSKD